MMKKKLKLDRNKNKNGFSLIEMAVGIGVLGIVSLGAAGLMSNTIQARVYSDISESINRTHYMSLSRGQSVKRIKDTLNNAVLTTCFSTGAGCPTAIQTEVNDQASAAAPMATDGTVPVATVGDKPSIQSDVHYDATQLGVRVSVYTGLVVVPGSMKNITFRPLRTSVFLPSMLFTNPTAIDWTCPANQFIVGINFNTRKAICAGIANSACADNSPLITFGGTTSACQVMCDKAACVNGFEKVSLFDGICACKPNACNYTNAPTLGACSAGACGEGTQTVTYTNSIADANCPDISSQQPCFGACP